LFPLFATGVVYIDGKLPPVSFAAGVVDTFGKFAAGVVGGKFAPVSLIRVVNLDLRISPRIFKKICNGPNGILWGKTRSKKSCDTVPLTGRNSYMSVEN
jgi:hypothetical protein